MWPILLALVPAFGWGFQGIVMQKVGGTTANKQMGMVLTTLLFGIVVLIFHPINWSWTLIAAAAANAKLTPASPNWAEVEAKGLLQDFFVQIANGGDTASLAKDLDEKIEAILNA